MRFGEYTPNYPSPELDSYLSLFDSERQLWRHAMMGHPANNAQLERDINFPVPKMWHFEGLRSFDPGARAVGSDTRYRLVHTGWVQQQLAAAGLNPGPRDCTWGTRTNAALTLYRNREVPRGKFVPQSGHRDWVALTRDLEDSLSLVADGTPFAPSMCARPVAPPPAVPDVTPPPPAQSSGSSAIMGAALLVGGAWLGYSLMNR